MDLFLPWILAYMIDHVVPGKSTSKILLWGGIMLVCSVVAVVTNITANRMANRVAADTTKQIRYDLFRKSSYLSSRQLDEFTIPSLISRLTSDTYNVHNMVGKMQRLGIRAPILLLGGIIMTLTLDPVLTLVLLAVIPFITGIVYIISKKGIPLYNGLQVSIDKLVRIMRENISGVRIIKALSKTDYEKVRFSAINNEVAAKEKQVGLLMAVSDPVMNLFLNVGITCVILAGAYRVNEGLAGPGTIIAFLSYFTIILNAMLSITRIFVLYSKGIASYKRIDQILSTPKDLTLCSRNYEDNGCHIAFENVSFSYHKNQYGLKHVSFCLKKGETLGIIGATGSGKSSIIRLLMRFYDADEGTVRIDGLDIKCIPEEELYTKFGVVFQNDVLFADTIAENIDFGRGISKDKIFRSSSLAQAHEFIDSLDDGWEHELTIRGTNLSGGQKQRILISRALAGDPEILILDDSSSALDYKTDARLRSSISQNYQNTTTVIIAQRVSSIKHANLILVLDDGEIIGSGTHNELMDACPVYKEISQSQMGVSPV